MKKLLNKLPFKKFIAVFTSITFMFTGVFGNSAFASIGTSMPAIDNIKFDNPIIPMSLGKITSAKYFDSEDIIIDIQDLHCHAETQRKIASIIGYIDNEYNINNVYLEGAFKTVDTSWLSAFNNNQNGTKVLEGLIDSGKLSGTEYYSIINNKKNFVLGIEKEELYKENIKLLGSILSLQPEIEAICSQLEKEIGKVKRDYSGRQTRKLQRLIKSFKEKEIDAKHFYSQLKILADSVNISVNKYPNVKIYISLLDKAQYVNDKKVIYEFTKFVSELKNVSTYQQYSDLLKRSNNFSNFDDISSDLINFNKKYGITKKLNLVAFENFLTYLEFNQNINPIKLVQEEESFINELYVKLGRTKYEKEVAFLADFIPTIKQYFTADISADEYYKFDNNYEMFKTIWPSYFSESILKNLDQYQKLLAKYHRNNITRDQIFADCLISQKNISNKTSVNDTTAAVKQIKSNLGKKKIKVVVTGGFHTRGLERIFEQQRISYIIITPKITQPVEQAKQIYIDNVMYYSNILKNTINLEPLTQEPLNVSFPKILNLIFSEVQKNTIFKEYSKDQINQGIKEFVQEYIISKQSGFYGNVEILKWDITSIDSEGRAEFYVEYKDNTNKGTISNIKYRFTDNQIIPYSSIDSARTKQMLERVTSNKYALPSIELEPSNSARKKIAKHVLEPLKKVAGTAVTLMPFGQLHMTIGYDSSPTQQQIDSLVQQEDTDGDIFSAVDLLGEDFVNFKTSMAGTLKLMPDGVIIYEITDKDLIENMLRFRTTLKGIDSKFGTPSIVHMSIGRITDMKLLDGSEQSKQELAQLLEKINETIYEINKKNALAKVKTTFTLKAGYVSSTGDKDFVFKRLLPKRESLTILKNIFANSKTKLDTVYEIIVAPIIEETVFRFVPFFVTGLIVANPASIVPVIVTGIVGILGFSFAHPMTDKINNYFYTKIENGDIKNSFLSELFDTKAVVRDIRNFLVPSIILTSIYIVASFIAPQSAFVALAVTTVLHSVYNFIINVLNVSKNNKNERLLTVIQSQKGNNLKTELSQITEVLSNLTKSKSISSAPELNKFLSDFKNIRENYDTVEKEVLSEKIIELFDFVVEKQKKQEYFDVNYLLVPLLNISSKIRDNDGNLLFNTISDFVLNQASDKKNVSTRYHDILVESAKYFYKNGEFIFVHKIIDSLYKNKKDVKSVVDYGRFALPLPSPFSFDTVEQWEMEITQIMSQDKDIFPNWYESMLGIFMPSLENIDEYAKAFLRALYKSGKQTVPPYIRDANKYELAKTFYETCGDGGGIFVIEQSEPLLNEQEVKYFTDKFGTLEISNLYLSDIISRLRFLRYSNPSIENLKSEQYSQIIDNLTAALSLPKQAQLQVVQEQINNLYTYLFENKKTDAAVFELLAPVLGLTVKDGTTTFLEELCNNLIERGTESSTVDFGFREMAYIYSFDKEKALMLIGKKFETTAHSHNPLYVQLYGRNWETFSPKTIEEARQAVPKELQKVIFEYNDLELFYNAIGISFDIIDEPSELFDRDMYVPEYQPLFSFVPNFVLKFKNITKYFRTLKSDKIKNLDIGKEKEAAFDRVLKNGNLALASISNSADDLKITVNIVEEMLKDLKLISSDTKAIQSFEDTLDYIKEKIKEGNIKDVLITETAWWVKDKGIYTLISDINEKAISETKNISDKFEAFEKVLENNELALSSLTRMNEDSTNDTIYFIEEMLDAFEIISPQLAQKAKLSLLRIKRDIKEGNVKLKTLSRLNPWTEDTLDKIKELHTLINAVHQTSTSKLMSMVGVSSNIGGRKVVLRQDGSDKITFYDCSEGSLKDEMKEFLVTLSELNTSPEGQWVIKDNKLLYSKQLGFHGVNILVDMEDGIRVTFNESGRGDGNALRTVLLATLFAQAGFDITYVDTLVTESSNIGGPCKFTAVYNLQNDSSAPEKYAFLFSQALEILSNTKDVDYALEDDNENENPHYHGAYYIPKLTIEDYRKMKNSFNMPEEFKKGKTGGLVSYWTARVEKVKQLRSLFEKSKQEEKTVFSSLYDYLKMDTDKASPWEIVSEYIKGKLIIGEDGVLERNENYDGISVLLNAIEKNTDDSLRQAQVINLLDSSEINFETEGYIGGMVALSGVLRLDGKGWLSVKTAVDKERKRSKFAYVEFVDFEGNRKNLTYKELIGILKDFGYAVKEQKPRSASEKKESLIVLKERILYPKDGIYTRGMSVSGQFDGYVPTRITYNKKDVDENSMWVVSFTSPEDVGTIIKAKAIMTTTGGMLSHANITARENGKIAILSNGQWVDGKLEIPYYSIESDIEQKGGYEIQKISEHKLVLEEGSVVLANGINGRVLVYNDISKETIAEIQKAIDENDVDFIMKYIQDHYQDTNINQVVEYIFLQVITDKEKLKIAQFLLAWDKDTEIGVKISELVKVYTGEKIKALKIYIENEKKIKDANIRLAVIKFIEQELDVLKYSLTNDTVVDEMQQLTGIVNRDRALALSQRTEEVKDIIKQVKEILAKTDISEQDKDYLTKTSETATVWNFYGSSELKDLLSKANEKLSYEQPVSYDTEIRGFEDITAQDSLRYGTKTTELAKMSKLFGKKHAEKATVPYGIGISKDVLKIFFEQSGLSEQYLQLISDFEQAIKIQNKSKAVEIGKQISKLIDSVEDEQLKNYLETKLKVGKMYAVRSSGVGEDGGTHAFAGMAETKLNVSNDEVYKNVKECWKSFFSYTCIEDMVKEGIVVQPALLVQEMVADVKKAGVMFTRDNSGNLTIESVLGLGDGLVSGRITPDHITVRASDGRIDYRRALSNMIKIVERQQGGTAVSKLSREEKIERILDEETINSLKEIAYILEEDAGYPVDIEFAIDETGKVFVLQRRAITTLPSFEELDYSEQQTEQDNEFIIDQSAIDSVIQALSGLLFYGEMETVMEKLSNLPDDAAAKYNVVVEQVYELVKFLKKNHKQNYNIQLSFEDNYGQYYKEDTISGKLRKFCLENNLVKEYDSNVHLSKVLIYILVPFLTMTDVNNSGIMLFYSIIDSLFTDGEKDRDEFSVLSEMGMLMSYAYSLNPNFVQYIVDKLMSKGLISADEEIPYAIKNELKGYNELKQYYFAIFSKEQINENLSKNLTENGRKLSGIISSMPKGDIAKTLTDILFNIDEISGKINDKNIILLEFQLDLLFNEALKLKDSDKDTFLEITGVILSVCEQMIKENKDINSRKFNLDKLETFLIDEYDSGSDRFNDIMAQLISIVQPADNDNTGGDSFNKQLCIMLTKVALHIYEPIASNQIEVETSQDYQKIKNQCLDIFGKLALKRVHDIGVYDCLFNIKNDTYNRSKKVGIGFTPETLKIFIEAAKRSGLVNNIFLPDEQFISEDIDTLSDMIVASIENINPVMMIAHAFSEETSETVKKWGSKNKTENEKEKQLSYNIMRQLVSLANDENVDLIKRRRAVVVLLNIIAKGIYSDVIKDVPIDFENVRMLANRFDLPEMKMPIYLHMGNVGIKNINLYYEYDFTPLIKLLPQDLFERAQLSSEGFGVWDNRTDNRSLLTYRKPVMTSIDGETDGENFEVLQVLFRFEVLQKILQYNTSVLSLMDKITDSKNYEKNMAELLNELQAMIDELKKINIEHGTAAQIALDNIKKSLKDPSIDRKTKVRRNLLLSEWNEDTIKDIKEIHTLINAIHQTSIIDFKQEVGDVRTMTVDGKNMIQTITASQQSTVSGYNLSENINSNIVKFLSKLATRKLPNDKIDDFVCKDDLVVWTTRLNAHSVDIFFNFGDVDRGINIYYRERPMPGEDIGKKERIRYFKEILEYLGFHVETDIQYSDGNESYGLKAAINKDYGLSDSTDLIDIATHVVEIFKFSTNVDYDLKNCHRTIEAQYKHIFESWLTKAKRRELWYGVDINNWGWRAYGYGPRGQNLAKLPEKRELNPEALNTILSYLGCDLLPADTEKPLARMLEDPNFVNKYFNEPIERAFVEGRLILNEEGVLVRNEGYDIVHSMIDEINTNFTETSQQARIVNLVNNYEYDTRILADIGSFVVVSSVMELKTGDKLFIRAIMDPNTRRTKYAIAELVTTKTRQKLTSEQLIEILGKEGYKISKQEWVDSRERRRTINLLSRDIQTIESPKIQSTPTSDGAGVSVVGNITFNKDNVDENSILVVPYTTPNDIKNIETAKGIITTGGGVLSHAAITTRELKKPSVVLGEAIWVDDEIETIYYLPSGDVELIDEQFKVQKVKTTRKMLKEGTRVLMNGETGTVLLFDDMDISLLDELQSYIDSDNAQSVIDFMLQHSNDENINRFVEYVYFQVIGNIKTLQVLDSLFSDDMPETVKNKINKLNDGYIQDKVQSISEAIENLKTIENVNIAYNILQELIKKLNFIKTVGVRQEIEDLRKQVEQMEVDIKARLNKYMQQFVNDLVDLLAKDNLSGVDVQKILTMLKNIEIYNFFVDETETSKDLLSIRDTIRVLVPMIKDKLNNYAFESEIIDLNKEISLFEENAGNEKLFGSKTSQLAKMFNLLKNEEGVTVPGGIGISVNVMPLLFKDLGQENLLKDFETAIKQGNKEEAMRLAKIICDLIDSEETKGSDMEKEVKKQLDKFITPEGKYSVRSSGVGEDAANNAFAGMGETSLNVQYENIYESIKDCWKSFFAERCVDYMISSGQVVRPAVLVEEMIDSEISGVAFTRDKYGNGRINALFGQGEGLVSGMFTPDSVLFDMTSGEVIEYSVANKQFQLLTDVNGGIKKVPVGQKAKTRALNTKMVKKLAEVFSILENSVGYPIDVEFAVKGEEIYILQMRPITTLDAKEKTVDASADVVDMQEIPFMQTQHEISLEVGKIKNKQDVFCYIANPFEPTQAVPVYKKSSNKQVTEFIIDSKYASVLKNGLLGRILMYRINMDPVLLAKLNDGVFNFKSGEIGLLPILDEDILEKALSDSTFTDGMNNIRNILASA
ncbi:PEP/pyruvate-binding domain-containing protein [Candidatus Ruminimicrobiellum ovillum]|uniref:PEP/pyruvate-binding domain-containing protein n=1 Tax=Candidatus Ruminimicrobiellum ovillum TaxID=1947927 RepID=UPI00355AB982